MGVKNGEQERNGHMSREKPWPNLKECSVKEEKVEEEGHKMTYFDDLLFTYQLCVK